MLKLKCHVLGVTRASSSISSNQESRILLENILMLQPRVAQMGSGEKSSEALVLEATSDILVSTCERPCNSILYIYIYICVCVCN
jgi:hypothetical protein